MGHKDGTIEADGKLQRGSSEPRAFILEHVQTPLYTIRNANDINVVWVASATVLDVVLPLIFYTSTSISSLNIVDEYEAERTMF